MMSHTHEKQSSQQEQQKNHHDVGANLLRTLTMFKKAVGRLVRRTYLARKDYPEVFVRIEETIAHLRAWIQEHRVFAGLPVFQVVLGEHVARLGELIA